MCSLTTVHCGATCRASTTGKGDFAQASTCCYTHRCESLKPLDGGTESLCPAKVYRDVTSVT